METKTSAPAVNRTLHPDIEPYDTGFLKVSDIHTIYYEQSGNPDGHVSSIRDFSTFSLVAVIAASETYVMLIQIYILWSKMPICFVC